jgi:hypothetical protein
MPTLDTGMIARYHRKKLSILEKWFKYFIWRFGVRKIRNSICALQRKNALAEMKSYSAIREMAPSYKKIIGSLQRDLDFFGAQTTRTRRSVAF